MISNIDKVLDAPTLLSGYGQSQSRRAAPGLPGQDLNATCQHRAVQGRVPIVRPSVVYTEDPEACNPAWHDLLLPARGPGNPRSPSSIAPALPPHNY